MVDDALLIGQLIELTDAQGKRIAALEQELAKLKRAEEIDARRDSLDIQTAAKGGNFKHYLDPGASPEENDRLLAEEARNFMNAGGQLPEGFSSRILAIAKDAEAGVISRRAGASTPGGA